ncbi:MULTISPECIES: L-rhamnose mutarotase [Streptomyces]|jgi:hypothetical protein|uniref:L-rhamnose mutarotase n=2 Tax=Streptomyces TaxID=1883 RepID=C9ZBD2_STRSW|nr:MULTISPECIES: L-rhamnose mutarotase [Streptomyces]MBP5873142.1 L-rhamnose mutarotase [Streptomyces sp. LBUM 1485]EMF56805.1 hypothetical protein SBD_1888 [Streptomyces bottropensis ATCC 25435]MBP5918853.1 L-rhamnose mutarotase [Streptomyces sp. LBUM 1483]MDX2539996.1 hypothetical protein [Streptomyces scabiei]MDX2625354.1 hypothetical protein [Streptomyces scabiei]
MKVALHTKVRADRIEEYEAAHRQVPEQLTVVIRAAGVGEWTTGAAVRLRPARHRTAGHAPGSDNVSDHGLCGDRRGSRGRDGLRAVAARAVLLGQPQPSLLVSPWRHGSARRGEPVVTRTG